MKLKVQKTREPKVHGKNERIFQARRSDEEDNGSGGGGR